MITLELSSTESIINKIRFLRWSLLPPYTYNKDEDERNFADYVRFYSKNIGESLSSTLEYLNALQKFQSEPTSEDAIRWLLAARSAFIEDFPFCFDELVGVKEKHVYISYILNLYRKDVGSAEFLDKLSEYYQLLKDLNVLLKQS